MQKRWLRYSLASLTLMGAALGSLLVACSDDDNEIVDTPDSGDPGPDPGPDASDPPDAGDPGPEKDATSPTPAKIYMVHAATNLGPDTDQDTFAGGVRVCYATATGANPTDDDFVPAPLAPLPSEKAGATPYAGLFIGTGGPFPSTGADLEEIAIRPYLMNAKRLHEAGIEGNDPSVPRCGKLLSEGGLPDGGTLEENVDYWQLPDIPAGTLKKDHTYILAVTGCTSNATAPAGFCGPGDDDQPYTPTGDPGVGNLKILVLELDTKTEIEADEFGVQVINLSPQQAAAKASTGPFKPTLLNEAGLDGEETAIFPAVPNFGEVEYDRNATAPTTLTKVKGLLTEEAYFAFTNSAPPDDKPAGVAKLNNAGAVNPEITVQTATTGDPTDTSELYVNGKAHTFILVGDPAVPPAQGPRTMHYLAFPNIQK